MADTKIRIVVEADGRNAQSQLRAVGDALANMGSRARSVGGDLSNMGRQADGIGGSLRRVFEFAGGSLVADGIRNIVSGLVDLGSQALDSYASFERLTMSLETFAARELLNAGVASNMNEAIAMSGERAQELLGWIEKLAVESPFKTEDIASAFRLAQAYGFTSDQAMRLTQATVDFAAGAGISGAMMDRISLALGQIQARGKVSAQELNQLSEAGINARQILADAFGVSTGAITDMIERGLVPANLAVEAITQSLEQDFGGAAKRQANTFSGLISSLSDIKSIGLREFFTGTFTAIQPLLIDFVSTVTNPAIKAEIRAWGDALGQQVAGGVQRITAAFAGFQSGGLTGLATALQIPQPIITGLNFAAQNVTALQGALLGLGAVFAGGAVVTGLTALWAGLTALITPIGLITVGAALLGAAWTTNFGNIQGITAEVAESIGGVVSAIQNFLAGADVSAATTALTQSFTGVKNALGELFTGDIGITEFTSKIFDAVSGIPDMVRNVFAGADFSTMRGEIITALGLDNVSFDLGALQTNISTAISGIDWASVATGFESLKTTIGTALNSVRDGILSGLTEQVNGINWSGISFGFAGMVDRVTATINGIDWSQISVADIGIALSAIVAPALTAGVAGIAWVVSSENLGGLITAVTAAISSIQWGELGQSFGGLATSVQGAFANLDWSTVTAFTEKANTTRDSIIQSLTNSINNIDWSQVGLNFANFINSVATGINNIDWSQISVGEIGAALGAVVAPALTAGIAGITWVLSSENFDDLTSAVVNAISSIDWGLIGGAFANLGTAVINAIANIDWSGVSAPFFALRDSIQSAINSALSTISFGMLGNTSYGSPTPESSSPTWLGFLRGHAAGTSSWRGGPTWVDEKGPELFRFPNGEWAMGSDQGAHLMNLPAGTQIYPHEDAQKMMGMAGLTPIGANAGGTTRAPSAWPGGGSTFGDLSQAAALGAKYIGQGGATAGKHITAAMKKATSELKSALQGVEGLFNTSKVTSDQMRLAELGVPQNFADDYLRRLTDEVLNGKNWDGVSIEEAAARAGIDPTLPGKVILEMFTQKWNDSSLFADKANLDLINMDAVKEQLARQAAAKAGEQNIFALFGIQPEQAQGQAVALGSTLNAGLAQGLAGTGAQNVGTQFVNSMAAGITPDMLAPVATQITSGIVGSMSQSSKEGEKGGVDIGLQIANAVVGQLTDSDALGSVGQTILQKIVDSWSTMGTIDIASKIAGAMNLNLGTADAIQILQDVGKKIFKLVFQGYDAAAAGADYVAPVRTGVNNAEKAQATATTTVTPPTQATGGRALLPGGNLAMAGAGGVTVNVYANVASQLDVVDVAYKVADIIQRRGRR